MTDSLELYQYVCQRYPQHFTNCPWTMQQVSKFERFALKGEDYVSCPKCFLVHFMNRFILQSKRPYEGKCRNTTCSHSFCIRCSLPWKSGHDCVRDEKKEQESLLSDVYIRLHEGLS
jgi:hypothetical protein